ncbi:sigma-70 family RNA polymerase sigma factor [Streptomyces sp. NPDC051954]|uniref:sigma-70 family RNA polymerase sigma factor n=1 Tax=unclassified Streptomyces TaxID=2593676 RepID=UPI00341AEE54
MSWTVMGSSGAMSDRERALRALYEEQAGPLYTYTVRLLGGDHYRAEDLVQEALLRCWRTQDLTSGQPLRPWLFRVARNLVVDDYRLRKARPQEVDGSAWLEGQLTSTDEVGWLLSSMVLKEAFQHLSTNHREALYETFFSGRSMREAGQVLGVPLGTVKSRVHHAIRALRMVMGVVENADDGAGEEPAVRYPSAA